MARPRPAHGTLVLPGHRTITRCTAANRPCAQTHPCDGCGRPFVKPEGTGKKGWGKVPIVVVEIEWTCMRGDDVVKVYHPECVPMEA